LCVIISGLSYLLIESIMILTKWVFFETNRAILLCQIGVARLSKVKIWVLSYSKVILFCIFVQIEAQIIISIVSNRGICCVLVRFHRETPCVVKGVVPNIWI